MALFRLSILLFLLTSCSTANWQAGCRVYIYDFEDKLISCLYENNPTFIEFLQNTRYPDEIYLIGE